MAVRNHFGTVKLGSSIHVSDPCYKYGTWCSGTIDDADPGQWECWTDVIWNTVGALNIARPGYEDVEPDEAMPFDCGVDSGQCGFYDLDYFRKHCDINTWYETVCQETLGADRAGVIDGECFVSCSGYGDGGYTCYVARDRNGKVVRAKIVFVEEDE